MKSQIAVIGLGVMGAALARNMAGKGYRVSVYNRTPARLDSFLERYGQDGSFTACESLDKLVSSLERPARILLMIKAGEAVDQTIEALIPLLADGDLVIDGGNSFYLDTMRRKHYLDKRGIHFVGMGVSGGEAGALLGPSLMPGGDREAYEMVSGILADIAARAPDGSPCCAYIGPGASGHFVKMVHNGIEYADMQLIAEAYHVMSSLLDMPAPDIARVFRDWGTGPLGSYLIEITASILSTFDDETASPIVDVIMDRAGQKGTGLWTVKSALDLGVAVPTIESAIQGRLLSDMKDERLKASGIFGVTRDRATLTDARKMKGFLHDALYASKICSYAQGMALVCAASERYRWRLSLSVIAGVWRAGCIIRARFLDEVSRAFSSPSVPVNLLVSPYFSKEIGTSINGLRRVVSGCALNGVPAPGFTASLSYFDSYRASRLPANLIQAQRDFFGAHGYERVDRSGTFHTDWNGREH